MRTIPKFYSTPVLAALTLSSLLLSACGAVPYSDGEVSGRAFKLAATEEVQIPDSDNSTTDNDSGGSTPVGSPPVSMRVGGIGYDTPVTVEVRTNKVLKVKFTPGIQDQTVSGTGFPPHYSGLGVYIQVGTTELPTPLLRNGYNNTAVQTSQVFDFSSNFDRTCLRTDTSCRQMVTITIKKPNYDHYSMTYPYGGYASWTHVWSTHPWHGTLEIQTDDTTGI